MLVESFRERGSELAFECFDPVLGDSFYASFSCQDVVPGLVNVNSKGID
jgi:hypothetical protein